MVGSGLEVSSAIERWMKGREISSDERGGNSFRGLRCVSCGLSESPDSRTGKRERVEFWLDPVLIVIGSIGIFISEFFWPLFYLGVLMVAGGGLHVAVCTFKWLVGHGARGVWKHGHAIGATMPVEKEPEERE